MCRIPIIILFCTFIFCSLGCSHFRRTETLPTGYVRVSLELQGRTVRGKPQVASANKPDYALFRVKQNAYYPSKTGPKRWEVALPAGESFVVGWISRSMKGYCSEPFTATDNGHVVFAPGMPCEFEYKLPDPPNLGAPPYTVTTFPANVVIWRKLDNGRYGGVMKNGSLTRSGIVRFKGLAQGTYRIDAQAQTNTRFQLVRPYLWDHRAIELKPGIVNHFSAQWPTLDASIEPGDVRIEGRLVNSEGKGVPGKEIILRRIYDEKTDDPNNGFRYFYPTRLSDEQGNFYFFGVDPKFLYQMEYWIDGNLISAAGGLPTQMMASQVTIVQAGNVQ